MSVAYSPEPTLSTNGSSTNEPFAETPVLVAELEREVEPEAEMSDCSIEGEDQC